MRYIIDTKDSEGIIGVQIAKWAKEQKIDLIEKADPILEIKANLEKTARALEALKQAGMKKSGANNPTSSLVGRIATGD